MYNHKKNAKSKLLLLAVTAALSACGSSQSNDTPAPPPVSTVVLPAMLAGTISQVSGSQILVNGHTINTRNIPVSYAGQSLSASVLNTGMTVEVVSAGNQVQQIKLNPAAAGKVTLLGPQQFSVAGQVFHFNTAALKNEDFVLVSARLQADGKQSVTALTLLSGVDIPLYFELEGSISQLSDSQQTFLLQQQWVDFSAARIEEGPLQNGQWVEVFGQYRDKVLHAIEVDVEGYRHQHADDMEIEGLVTWVNAEKTAFELSGKMVLNLSQHTRFEDGTLQELVVGRHLEVTVKQQTVTKIEFSQPAAAADAIKLQQFSLTGTASYKNGVFSINGFVFQLDSYTRYKEQLTTAILDGIDVEIEGVVREGQLIVREIERADNEPDIELEGMVINGTLWGYTAADDSLQRFEGKWVEVDCWFDGVFLSQCKADD